MSAVDVVPITRDEFISAESERFLLNNEALNNIALTTLTTLKADPQKALLFGANIFLHGSKIAVIAVSQLSDGNNACALCANPGFPPNLASTLAAKIVAFDSLALHTPRTITGNDINIMNALLEELNKSAKLKDAYEKEIDLLVYELDKVDLKRDLAKLPAGFSLRWATQGNVEVLRKFSYDFSIDIGHAFTTHEMVNLSVDTFIREKRRVLLFDDALNEPVSMAGFRLVAADSKSVGGVYTPPAHRKRGYATRCVARFCLDEFERGTTRKFFLFADARNPTSNKIYQHIGFRYMGTSLSIVLKSKEK